MRIPALLQVARTETYPDDPASWECCRWGGLLAGKLDADWAELAGWAERHECCAEKHVLGAAAAQVAGRDQCQM